MSDKQTSIFDVLIKRVISCTKTIAANKGIPFNVDEIKEKLLSTYKIRLPEILEEMRKDAKAADFLNGMGKGVVHQLPLYAGKVAMEHGCVMYAKELLGISDTEPTTNSDKSPL